MAKYHHPASASEPQGTPRHDGQPQPPEAKPPPPTYSKVNTTDDPADHDPLAGAPTPKGGDGLSRDSDEQALKPVLRGPNNRTGGG